MDINGNLSNLPFSVVMLSFLLFFPFACFDILFVCFVFLKKEKRVGAKISFHELHPAPYGTWSGYLHCYRVVLSHLFYFFASACLHIVFLFDLFEKIK